MSSSPASAKSVANTRLWTRDFVLVFASNLLLFFSFYMLIPVLPLYLLENLKTSGSVAGLVLSLYTIAALVMRPFSGFIVDAFSRKPLYLLCYAFFSIIFAGYTVATVLALFIILRVLHGFAFGITTVSGSTVAVDLMNPARRGEGIGYFGMAANIAMAVGPSAGLWLQKSYSFNVLFLVAFAASLAGLITIVFIKPIKTAHHKPAEKQPLTLDKFVLVKALPCVALLFIAGLGYGSVLNYAGLYSETAAFRSNAGVFFMILSAGIVIARIMSAKAINSGRIVLMIYVGGALLVISFGLFTICSSAAMLYAIAFLLGISFGYITPAFQTMLINLADSRQRGTANATYFTFWDMGIGLGTAVGGTIIERLGFTCLYALCAAALVAGIIYFITVSAKYYKKHIAAA